MLSLFKYAVCFFIIYIQYPCFVIASGNSNFEYTKSSGLTKEYLQNLLNLLQRKLAPSDLKKVIISYNLKSFKLNKKNKLYTNISNNAKLISTLNKIILNQDDLFLLKDKRNRPYNIFLIDNCNFDEVQGTAKEDYIIVVGDFKKDINDYIRVVSHELIHRYIGHTIKQDHKNDLKNKWFFEGFTEFYAVTTLFNTKVIDKIEYLKAINVILEEYFNSLVLDINFEKIDTKCLMDPNIRILNYHKGFILAMVIDEKLKQVSYGKYCLQNVIKEIIHKVASEDARFDIKLFTNYLRHYLPEPFTEKVADSINNSKILQGLLPITMLNKSLASKYTNKYRICFNVAKSIELKRIQGVKVGNDCHNMGLRNGQELKCCSIDYGTGKIRLKVFEQNNKNKILKTINFNAIKIKNAIPVYN